MNAHRSYRPPDTSELMACLTKPQKDLVVAIAGNRCAFRNHRRWRPKGEVKGYALETGDALIMRDLAMINYGKGSPRLVLTYKGEGLALEIKFERQQKAKARAR